MQRAPPYEGNVFGPVTLVNHRETLMTSSDLDPDKYLVPGDEDDAPADPDAASAYTARDDHLLDQELENTFPASDPPAAKHIT